MNRKRAWLRLWVAAWLTVGLFGGSILLSRSCLVPEMSGVSAAGKTKPQDEQALIAAGSKLFTPTCSSGYCHGKDGTGGGGPALRNRNFTADHLARVISEGIPGTAMRSFREDYSREQIRQLVAYVLALSKGEPIADAGPSSPDRDVRPASASNPTSVEPAKPAATDPLPIRGDAAAGRALFFDATQEKSCGACHTFQGRGGKLGPDLSQVGNQTARELLQSIIFPRATVDPAYATLALTTREGERVVGLKRDEDDEVIRLYDLSSLPPVSRAFPKSQVVKVEKLNTSAMPGDYAARYSLKQLLDLITFLKSAGPAAQAGVSLKDLF